MRHTISYAFIGSALASAAATVLLVVQWERGPLGASLPFFHAAILEQLAIDVSYLWCGATVAALVYGAVAVKFGIYGRGAVTFENWKNALLGLLIIVAMIPIASLAQEAIGASDDTIPWFIVATGLAISISDACASTARRRRK